MTTSMPLVPTSDPSGRLVPTEGRTLPLVSCDLRVDARAGLSRVILEQTFTNPHAEPLSVTYRLPLPADAAVSAFCFRIGERTIRGVIEGRSEARETYERAIAAGRSAALLEQDRSSLFTQEIGNIPPGQTVVARIEIDQPLAWLAEGSWEWRFPLAAAPRYLGAGTIEGDVSLDVASGEIGARASLAMVVRDAIPDKRSPESPSHPLVCSRAADAFEIELGSGNQVPIDRDVVVRWPVATMEPGVALSAARPAGAASAEAAFGLLTLVPPLPAANAEPVARDLTLLLDTSGSMSGEPLEQAKRVACAMIDTLTDRDTLEMIEFSSRARAFTAQAERATKELRTRATKWVRSLVASGGTEMLTGVREALRDIRAGSQRQVVILTDGLVGFERDVVRSILDGLPASARFHAVGVGSAVNRSLLAPVARAGRGVETIVGLGEDPERAAERLLARTTAPVVVDLAIEGSAVRRWSPSRLPDLFAGAPARVALEIAPEGGEIVVRGRGAGGAFERRITIGPVEAGQGSAAVATLFGREIVEDLEMRLTSGEDARAMDREIESIGKRFSIATRLTSFVAVTDEPTVDPRAPSRREAQPQALPYGMSAEGLGLRQALGPMGYPGPMPSAVTAPSPAPQVARSLATGMAPPRMGAAPPPPSPGRMRAAKPPEPAAPDARSKSKEEQAELEVAALEPGLFETAKKKMRDLFSGGADRGIRADDADLPPPEEAPSPARRLLAGRILFAGPGSATVEVVVGDDGAALVYEGAVVRVTLADGAVVEGRIDAASSTREGSYPAGVVLRLTITHASGALAPSSIEIELGDGTRIVAPRS